MLASKLCIFGTAAFPGKGLLSASRYINKSFNTSDVLALGRPKRVVGFQRFHIFSRPQLKSKLLCRKNTTTVPSPTAPSLNATVVEGINYNKQIGYWLVLSCGMVYGAVTLGGFTRLTESGLSMVNWRFTFENMPKTETEWIEEFNKYQNFPEFKLLKKEMTLEEFKQIFTVEYLHRTWGRFIGLIYFVPAISFWLRGKFSPQLKKRVAIYGGLIIMQGLLGWYMVKSGLEDRFDKPTDVPRVSQYRLAAHFGMALILFAGLCRTALECLSPAQKNIVQERLAVPTKTIKILLHSCKGLVFLTALSGTLVAGLDAGLLYGTFPKMGDKWIPDDMFSLTPFWKNFTENPTMTQFNHRLLGITTFSTILGTWIYSRRLPFSKSYRKKFIFLAAVACGQALLGISTLVHQVPVSLALAHQSGSILLLLLTISLSHPLKYAKYIPK